MKTEVALSEMVEELFYSWCNEFHVEELQCKSRYSDFRSDGDAIHEFTEWIKTNL